MDNFDVCIVGAGVVGIATAYALSQQSQLDPTRILLLEAQQDFGQGVSSRSSEVIHGGIYYPTGSLKAELCVKGKQLLYAYASAYGIGHKRCGKLIVAQKHQGKDLNKLYMNGLDNGVNDLELLSKVQLKQLEPALTACSAILSPSTGIIDSHHYMHSLLAQAQSRGVLYVANTHVLDIEHTDTGIMVHTGLAKADSEEASYTFSTSCLVNCCGLNSPSISRKIKQLAPELIPKQWLCKGDYFSYSGKNPFSHLIYPVPEANTAGLGVHSTMDLSGQLRFGPDVEYIDEEHYQIDAGKAEMFATAVASYFPAVQKEKLEPAYSGIRPKLAGPGEAPRDFEFQTQDQHGLKGLIQLHGIESPGLTASLAIGEHITTLLD